MLKTDEFVLFLNGPFSNFYGVSFIYEGLRFNNTEQAFMYAKASTFNDTTTMDKLRDLSLTPKEAKQLGRLVSNYDDSVWASIRYQKMLEVNREKFKNDFLRKTLKDTGERTLVECNKFDNIWGVGLAIDDSDALNPSKWKGTNLLGKVLMEIRSEI